MYLRITKVRRGSRTYEYAQLVEGYRRADGKPTNRVLANLGRLDEVAIANLRAALEASREGRALPVGLGDIAKVVRPTVEANLRYLDLAVLVELWRRIGLDDLLRRCLPAGDRTVASCDVVTALVLQRCVAPASKLAAERWYPTTALPELQGIEHRAFNNSRLHRALTDLERVEPEIQDELAPVDEGAQGSVWRPVHRCDRHLVHRRGTSVGPEGHRQGGRLPPPRRRRDAVRPGRDTASLEDARRPVPRRIVAAGHGVRGGGAGVDPRRPCRPRPSRRTRRRHRGARRQRPPVRYGAARLRARELWGAHPVDGARCAPGRRHRARDRREARAGRLRRRRPRSLAEGPRHVRQGAGKQLGGVVLGLCSHGPLDALEARTAKVVVSERHARRHQPLRAIVLAVRERLRRKDADRLGFEHLLRIAALPPEEQADAAERELREANGSRRGARRRARPTYRARAVVAISPERLLADRRVDNEHVAAVHEVAADITRRLSRAGNRRSDASAVGEVEQAAKKYGLGSVLDARIEGQGSERRVSIDLDPTAWARRRRGDGINVVVSHPEVAHEPAEMIRLYFSKDAIERDFRIIKSVVELRPVHHRTDIKLRAHVTICMLALALLRALEQELEGHGVSAARALEQLEPVRLNLIGQGKTTLYTVTRPDTANQALLAHMGMPDLVDDVRAGRTLHPR